MEGGKDSEKPGGREKGGKADGSWAVVEADDDVVAEDGEVGKESWNVKSGGGVRPGNRTMPGGMKGRG